jgi:cytosolic phospholipase A2
VDGAGGGSKLSLSGWSAKAKDFAKNLKPNIMAAKAFLSLESRITKDLYDPARFPEVTQQAVVRRGIQLCPEEQTFLAARKAHVRDSFARYMGWDPAQIHPDDVPTIAFGGSGGGYRALLAVLGYSKAMKEAGLWDLITYISGVSGSCNTLDTCYEMAGN